MPSADTNTLQAVNLECLRGDHLLFSGLGFTLREGQLMQVEGANGRGKTSLLRIVAGLSLASEGQVLWNGEDILAHRAAYFSQLAYLGHTLGVKADLSPVENLKITLSLAGVPPVSDTVYQALAQTGLAGKEDVPARSLSAGQAERFDCEYERCGTASLFMLFEPLAGRRHVEVTARRTAVDFAHVVRGLADVHYPEAKKIALVTGNLNTHRPASLCRALAPEEARRLAERLEIHYTPKHGSGLDMAEIELSALATQCLDRGIADVGALTSEVAAWQASSQRGRQQRGLAFQGRRCPHQTEAALPVNSAKLEY